MSNEPTPVTPRHIDWLGEWDRHGDPKQRAAYMASELDRIEAKGEPLLYAVLSCPLQDQQDLGVRVLTERTYTPMLRLRSGYTAWPKDPDGRDMPDEIRGKALRCKVGVRGQMPVADVLANPHLSEAFTGPMRLSLQRAPQGLHKTLDVTASPKPVPLEHAIVILRQWGVGITPKRFYKAKSATPMDRWAVEEVPQVEAPAPSVPEPRKRTA